MKRICFLVLILILTSCGKPSAEIIQTAIAETQVINQNATRTAEEFNSNATATAERFNSLATGTALSQTRISYAQTQTAIPTNTPTPLYTETPTATPIPPRLITATAVQATRQYVAEFKTIPWKELKGYPDNHHEEKIKIAGRILQIIGGEELMLIYPGTHDAFKAVFDTSFTGIYENQTITIYGTVIGEYCYNTQSGGTNCVPEVSVEWYTK